MRVRSPAGFTLIEVLAALFVLSVGLLGAAAMQAKARALYSDAAQRSEALLIATSLAERMRANPVAMSLPDASNPYLRIDIDSSAASAAGAPCFGGANCTPSDLAAFDALEAARNLHDAFPHARLLVCRDGSAATPAAWECEGAPAAPIVVKIGWRGRQAYDFRPSLALAVAGGGA